MKKVAIIQHGAVHLNKNATLEKLLDLLSEAIRESPDLIALGECWFSGYPAWLDHCPEVAFWDNEPMKEVYLKVWNSSITIDGVEINTLKNFAKKNKISIVIGINEKLASGSGNGTIYNSLLTINEKGELANHHRKLVPTYTEKMIYGNGDGAGLKAVNTSVGRLTGAICWEHWMPLTRQALHNEGEDIHVAVWPTVHEKHIIASRHYAFEGRCFVIAVGQIMYANEFPENLSLPKYLVENPKEMILKGGSCLIAPNGDFIIEPVYEKETILFGEVDLDQCIKEQMTLDTTGHYQRNDVFNLSVNKERIKE